MSAWKIARTALVIVLLAWAGWELLYYWFSASEREAFAQECREKGWVLTSGPRGQMCGPKQ